MRRWFLSYNSKDLALMEALEAALRRKDAGAHIFFAPKTLRAGGYWMPQLAGAIAQATIFVLLVGEKGLGPWQIDEYYEARDRRVTTVLMLLEGQPAPGLPFLRQLHWIVTANPAAEQSVAQLMDAAAGEGTRPGQLWRHAAPYRGLVAMEQSDSDFFFGREQKTVEVLKGLEATPDRLTILLGNSGVGKSSLAQAGVLAALARQGWPENAKDAGDWPQSFRDSRRWCFVRLRPGTEPLKALVEPFLRTWRFEATDPLWSKRQDEYMAGLLDGKLGLRHLLDATERRHEELQLPKPPAFFLYIDQGEELYVRAEERQRTRFSEAIGHGLGDRRLRALMSLRADFFGELHKDEPLYVVHRLVNVPPLREAELREVVSRPAELLSARFETGHLAADIAQRGAADSAKDAGALPLLSYLLDDMWTKMLERDDGVLRLSPGAIELGRVLLERANMFLADHPKSEDQLRRIFTLKLATVREGEEPIRRRAPRSEFTDDEWRLVSELADHPNRLVVTATSDAGETYVEVAHEAIFRRWDKLRDWIAAEREFLAWRTGLEAANRAWQAVPIKSKDEALLMGLALSQAEGWVTKRPEDIPGADRQFIALSTKVSQKKKLRVQTLVWRVAIGEAVAIFVGFFIWANQGYYWEQINWYMTVRPYMRVNFFSYVLSPEGERALKPGAAFRECAKDCPEMVVVPAGEFMMGSPTTEKDRSRSESPQHKVTISKPFAVSTYQVTFADWDACVTFGSCVPTADAGLGRGTRPVINTSRDDAQTYVRWLSLITGKDYRLLSEAEWEYSARAGSETAYSFGDDPAMLDQYAWYKANSGDQTHPTGAKRPNPFGLFDMAGNVWQWIEDCYHNDYDGAPYDGSAWITGACDNRVVRGGSWSSAPPALRSANRERFSSVTRINQVGFRVRRTLSVGADAPGEH